MISNSCSSAKPPLEIWSFKEKFEFHGPILSYLIFILTSLKLKPFIYSYLDHLLCYFNFFYHLINFLHYRLMVSFPKEVGNVKI